LLARTHGHEVVHITEDTDVSGAVSPFRRPGLGPWLTEPAKLAQWDVLVAAKLDRASRSVRDLHELVDVLGSRGKSYASVGESFDLTSAAGKLMVTVLGLWRRSSATAPRSGGGRRRRS
jgi:site-specific DNA recombinase